MMDRALLGLLGGKREMERGGFSLRILTARELLMAREEARTLSTEPELEGLCSSACMLARAVTVEGKPVFSSGQAVLETWSAERIGEEMAAYRGLADREDPDCARKEKLEEIMEQLKREPMERVRWRVQRAFFALPTEGRVRDMTEGDYLYCAAQMLLDREAYLERLCPQCRSKAEEAFCPGCGRPMVREMEGNPNFDVSRFEELKAHG